ncbi:hypothetical protein EHQ96_16465 [Leptospira levettii]|uniref:DUF5683 domain-containing protein n=1 Tax=Leptospira levettii TaxID=2023178 RepID=A0A5F2AB78_9LEPT|nr:DUF5683 domain-containing protein [Leptospira levettii]MCW7466410.1 DUF5683 domain-containing protein [Leptospira levettii]MCW7512024.1 DUF5683 domain-containing protein [Leptospira levettii]MCW7515784.1 DUF5683 domain-containing protein [Leptospira levettii]TGL67602.1 hypothetical protein EHQ60_15425 [Leptospira levettii]TGM28102.1 hypothetical protein EHQ74_01605 [Leptospira levettii]
MWNKKGIFVFIFILIGFPIWGEPDGEEGTQHQLRWMEVEGATGYVLEIKNSSGYLVLSEKVKGTSYDLVNYTSGVYEHRVAVINKLGKVGSYSDWVKFEVVVSRVPTLSKDSVFSVSKEEKEKVFLLEGKDFIHPMKVYMVTGGKRILAKKVVIESDSIAKATFAVDPDTDTGIYDLVLENPRNKTLTVKQRVVLSDSKERANNFAKRQEKIIRKEIPEDYYETPYWSTLWRSSILPGWGQKYIDGKDWKLYVYPAIAISAVAVYANSYNRFLAARSDYQSAVLLGAILADRADTQVLWLLNRNNAETSFNRAKSELGVIQVGAGILGAFLIYNLVDSYFSAKRNVASYEPGFPIGNENQRVYASMQPESGFSQTKLVREVGSRYQIEISSRF